MNQSDEKEAIRSEMDSEISRLEADLDRFLGAEETKSFMESFLGEGVQNSVIAKKMIQLALNKGFLMAFMNPDDNHKEGDTRLVVFYSKGVGRVICRNDIEDAQDGWFRFVETPQDNLIVSSVVLTR